MFPVDRGVRGDLQAHEAPFESGRDKFTRSIDFDRASDCQKLSSARRACDIGTDSQFRGSRSLVAQGDDRIDLAGAARGQPTGEQAGGDQNCNHHGERNGFDGADAFHGPLQ